MQQQLKFKQLKNYISVVDRISICNKETLNYENYRNIRQVPDLYDELYVCGIGIILSEFEIDDLQNMCDIEEKYIGERFYFAKCIEILVSENSRK